LVEGKKIYYPISKAISKFFGDIDESLSEFKDAILPVFNFLKSKEIQKAKERRRLPDSNKDFKLRRRKGQGLISNHLKRPFVKNPKRSPPGRRSQKGRRFWLQKRWKQTSKCKRLKDWDEGQKEDIRMEDNLCMDSRPIPSRPMTTTLTKELVFTSKPLAT
jgi:hypothetical protein